MVDGGPSEKAGIRAGNQATQIQGFYSGGDLITAVDGQKILEFSELLKYLMLNKQPGDDLILTVMRDGKEMDFTVTLGERPGNGQ